MCDISFTRLPKLFPLILLFLTLADCEPQQLDTNVYQTGAQQFQHQPQQPQVYANQNPYEVDVRQFNTNTNNRFNPPPNEGVGGNIGRPPPGDVRALLQSLDLEASQQCTRNVDAQWGFETNVNQATQLEAVSIMGKKQFFSIAEIIVKESEMKERFPQLSFYFLFISFVLRKIGYYLMN